MKFNYLNLLSLDNKIIIYQFIEYFIMLAYNIENKTKLKIFKMSAIIDSTKPLLDSLEMLNDSIKILNATIYNLADNESTKITNYWFWINSIIVGFITSLVFLAYMLTVKPNIKISDKICYNEIYGSNLFFIKFYNTSRFYPIHEIKVEAELLEYSSTKGGKLLKSHKLNFRREPPLNVPRFNKKDENATYAVCLSMKDNLDELWSSNMHQLRLVISCKHYISGFTRVFIKEYHTKEHTLTKGKFEFGKSLNVS